jgi:hypothetical protein
MKHRPDQHAEADEQADLAHDLAEAGGDRRQRRREADTGR